MSTVCDSGLFVGVGRYTKLDKSRWLDHASNEATRLCEYFQEARPTGDWKALVYKKPKLPTRVDLLAALTRFADEVDDDGTGLFYFSGHAAADPDSGLILKSYDARDTFPHDTGLPLARVLKILKKQAANGKCFLVILDCCRDGVKAAVADDIPPNVCIMYACGQGSPAFETDHGGVLTRSIIESLKAIARDTGSTSCTVRALSNRLSRQVFAWRSSQALTHELYGNWAEKISLPIVVEGPSDGPEDAGAPSCWLRYVFPNDKEYVLGSQKLAGRICNWYGIPVRNRPEHPDVARTGGRAFVSEHFEPVDEDPDVDREDSRMGGKGQGRGSRPDSFQVRIPGGTAVWNASAFLTHLIDPPVSPSAPETLIFEWPAVIDDAVFRGIRHAVDGEWLGGAGGGHYLTWKNTTKDGTFRGIAWVSPPKNRRTRVVLTCETLSSNNFPIFPLLPQLRDVYDLFLAIRSRPEQEPHVDVDTAAKP